MKKKLWLYGATLAVAAIFAVVSCSKQSHNNKAETESAPKERVASLALRFTQPIGDDYTSVIDQYHKLNESELKTFWLSIYHLLHNAGDDGISESAFMNSIEKINESSMQQFGRPLNKVSDSQAGSLFADGIKKITPSAVEKITPPPSGDCPQNTYPQLFYPTYSPFSVSPASISITDVKDANYEDPGGPYFPCSALEYTYSGQLWSNICAITPLGVTCLNSGDFPNWPWKVRTENGTTKLYAPKAFVLYFFGSYQALNNNLRLATAAVY